MQHRDGTAPPFHMKPHFPFVSLFLSPSLSVSLFLSLGHPHKTTSFVLIDPLCQHLHSEYRVKSGRRESESNVLQSPGLYSVNYFFIVCFLFCFFFVCHRANGVQQLRVGDR